MKKKKREKKDMGSGRTRAENSDKLSDKSWARAGLYIRSLVSIKSSPLARQAPDLPEPICTCIPIAPQWMSMGTFWLPLSSTDERKI